MADGEEEEEEEDGIDVAADDDVVGTADEDDDDGVDDDDDDADDGGGVDNDVEDRWVLSHCLKEVFIPLYLLWKHPFVQWLLLLRGPVWNLWLKEHIENNNGSFY